jgi:hypothetical protein
MTLKQQTRLLNLAIAAGLLATVGLAWWGTLPTGLPAANAEPISPRQAHAAATKSATLPPLSEFDILARRPLRRAKAVRVAIKRNVRCPLKLTGIVIEAGNNMAFFSAGRETIIASEGETHKGVKIIKIKSDAVEIEFSGQTSSLTVEDK